jgi:low affinity Fe/Cu permease
MDRIFTHIASRMATWAGQPITFILALGTIILWVVSGPIFHWSDTWQLVINTGTTIVTFLMVFLIQNTQNRDSAATQLKLDELIRSTRGAHNALLDLEKLSTKDLESLRALYQKLADQARQEKKGGWEDTDTPELNRA